MSDGTTDPDGERLRWLLSGHTAESLAKASAAGAPQPDVTPQDRCIAELACWYMTLEEGRAIIDRHRAAS